MFFNYLTNLVKKFCQVVKIAFLFAVEHWINEIVIKLCSLLFFYCFTSLLGLVYAASLIYKYVCPIFILLKKRKKLCITKTIFILFFFILPHMIAMRTLTA
jgi:hypothetical protein